MKPILLVAVFPGTNCERETASWLANNLEADVRLIKGDALQVEIADSASPAAVVLPGGFSFGDYLRAGALAARLPFMERLKAWAAQGVPVLGICNGFQILCEAQLLPGSLTHNRDGHHLHKLVRCTLETRTKSPWLLRQTSPSLDLALADLTLPISCGMGRFVPSRTADGCYVALRYLENEVGSFDNIAAIAKGSVLGIMPHPERASDPALGCNLGLTFLAALAQNQHLNVKPNSALAQFIDTHRLSKYMCREAL